MENIKDIARKYLDHEPIDIYLLEEGFSVDIKYVVDDEIIVREIAINRLNRFKFAKDVQEKFIKVGKTAKVYDLIVKNDKAYYITEYLQGDNGLNVIQDYSNEEQYNFGVETANELALFHNEYRDYDFDMKEYIDELVDRKLNQAMNDPHLKDISNIEFIINTIRDNKHILYKLEGVINHSDYHLFNMIFDKGNYMGIIDFERARKGMFITDFRNNAPHNAPASKYFASGAIDGYLNINIIENFFEIENLNTLIISLGAVSWVSEFDKENLEETILNINELFENFTSLSEKPKWYVGKY